MSLREIDPPANPPGRYSTRPFPPYRYVPGVQPHPVAHPLGHSYDPAGRHPQPGPLLPPERWAESDDYLYGVDLYNHGYWWEAHEAWEGLWQQTDKRGCQGRFLQGLIQVSAANLKRHVGEQEGMRRLLDRARQHLSFVQAGRLSGSRFMGLDVADFCRRVEAYFAEKSSIFPALSLVNG